MKQTILVAPGIGYVWGTLGATETLLLDRIANGDSFPGEMLVRLPRGEWRQGIDGRLRR